MTNLTNHHFPLVDISDLSLYAATQTAYQMVLDKFSQWQCVSEYSINAMSKLGKSKFIKHIRGLNESGIFDEKGNIFYLFLEEYKSIVKISYTYEMDYTSLDIVIYTSNYQNFELIIKMENKLNELLLIDKNILVANYKIENDDSSYSLNIKLDESLPDSLFPSVSNVKQYIDDYLNSDSSLLLLYGPPGTGKTTFIKRILKEMAKTSDSNVINVMYTGSSYFKPSRILTFLEDNYDVFVAEDLDNLLLPREKGNDFMSTLLNITDGLVKNSSKKLIITTNILNIKNAKIDPALIRLGRTHDTLRLGLFETIESVNNLYDDLDKINNIKRDFVAELESSKTLAEVTGEYNKHKKVCK